MIDADNSHSENKKTISLTKLFRHDGHDNLTKETELLINYLRDISSKANNESFTRLFDNAHPLTYQGENYLFALNDYISEVKISSVKKGQYTVAYFDSSNNYQQHMLEIQENNFRHKRTVTSPITIEITTENLTKSQREAIAVIFKSKIDKAKEKNKSTLFPKSKCIMLIDNQPTIIYLPDFIISLHNENNTIECIGQNLGQGTYGNVREITSVGLTKAQNDFIIKEKRRNPDYVRGKNSNRKVVKITKNRQSLKREYEMLQVYAPDLIKGYGSSDGIEFLILHKYEKKDLAKYITELRDKKHKEITLTFEEQEKIIYLMAQLIDLLVDLEKKEINHQDIKPENIFVEADGKLKIGDFGLACKKSDKNPLARTPMGSPIYAEPAYFDNNFGVRSDGCDVHAMGLILCQLLGAERPEYCITSETATDIRNALPGMIEGDINSNKIFQRFADEKRQYFNQVKDYIGLLNNPFFDNEAMKALLEVMLSDNIPSAGKVKEKMDAIITSYDKQYNAANKEQASKGNVTVTNILATNGFLSEGNKSSTRDGAPGCSSSVIKPQDLSFETPVLN